MYSMVTINKDDSLIFVSVCEHEASLRELGWEEGFGPLAFRRR